MVSSESSFVQRVIVPVAHFPNSLPLFLHIDHYSPFDLSFFSLPIKSLLPFIFIYCIHRQFCWWVASRSVGNKKLMLVNWDYAVVLFRSQFHFTLLALGYLIQNLVYLRHLIRLAHTFRLVSFTPLTVTICLLERQNKIEKQKSEKARWEGWMS